MIQGKHIRIRPTSLGQVTRPKITRPKYSRSRHKVTRPYQSDSAKVIQGKPIRIRPSSLGHAIRIQPRVLGQSSFSQGFSAKVHSAKGSRPKFIQPRVLGQRPLGQSHSVEGHSAKALGQLIRSRPYQIRLGRSYLGKAHSDSAKFLSYSAMATRPK